jgi:hypothetical protein
MLSHLPFTLPKYQRVASCRSAAPTASHSASLHTAQRLPHRLPTVAVSPAYSVVSASFSKRLIDPALPQQTQSWVIVCFSLPPYRPICVVQTICNDYPPIP